MDLHICAQLRVGLAMRIMRPCRDLNVPAWRSYKVALGSAALITSIVKVKFRHRASHRYDIQKSDKIKSFNYVNFQ